MKNITDSLSQYRYPIESFISKLEGEKRYYNLTTERVMNWDLVMVEMAKDEIVAIAGLERKLGLIRSGIMLRKELHRKGFGKRFLFEVHEEAKNQGYHVIWGLVSEGNAAAVQLATSLGYKFLGKRQNMDNVIAPLDSTGRIIYYLARALFPLVKVIDKVRR